MTGTGLTAAGTRRRGEALERAIFAAVIDQLAAVGYAGLTMDGVAAAASTGKAALYRRWPSKAELVADALDHALPAPEDAPDRGNIREDLIEHMRQKAVVLNSQVGRAVQSLLAEIERDRPMIRLVNERVFAPRLNVFGLILARGAERGEIPPGAVSPLVADLGPAMLVQRFLGDSAPIPDEFLVAIVDDLIMPLLGHPRPGTRPAGHPADAADRPLAALAAAVAALETAAGSGSRPLPSRRPGLRALWRASAWEVVLRGL